MGSCRGNNGTMLRARSVLPLVTRHSSTRLLSTIDERGSALEDEYFRKREQEMLRKLRKHSVENTDKPIVPDHFVRRSSFKVKSLEHAAEIDAVLIDAVIPLPK